MSYLARLRAKLLAAGSRTLLYVIAALLLMIMAWWLLAARPGATRAGIQPSAIRRAGQRVAAPPTPKLQINDVRQTGQIVEIKGTAECDAAVMINGERVPLIFEQCGFKHFILLPDGPSTIAVTAQGPAGGVNTQLIKVKIE